MKMLHTVRIPAGDSSESDELFIRSLSTSSMGSSSQQDSLESSYEWVAENKLGDSSEEVSSEQDWQPQTKSQRSHRQTSKHMASRVASRMESYCYENW